MRQGTETTTPASIYYGWMILYCYTFSILLTSLGVKNQIKQKQTNTFSISLSKKRFYALINALSFSFFMPADLTRHCFQKQIDLGYLLGKGWPLGSSSWCVIVSVSLSHWYPGSGVVLDCIDS